MSTGKMHKLGRINLVRSDFREEEVRNGTKSEVDFLVRNPEGRGELLHACGVQ